MRLKLEKFNYIFNTIPKKIFYSDLIDDLNKDVFILDITRIGVDGKNCLEKSISFESIGGIPGKFKPISSEDCVLGVLQDLGYDYVTNGHYSHCFKSIIFDYVPVFVQNFIRSKKSKSE